MITNLITPGTTAFVALCFAGYILLANSLAYAAFAVDKARAVNAQRRIPERSLLMLAMLGGWIGAKAAQYRLRHKTRKQPFGILLNLSVLIIPAAIATMFLLQTDINWASLPSQVSTKAQSLLGSSPTAAAPVLPHRFGPGSDADAP